MTVVVKFSGGPRHNKRNTMQGLDVPPVRIPVKLAECKAKNMRHGVYEYKETEVSEAGVVALYRWAEK